MILTIACHGTPTRILIGAIHDDTIPATRDPGAMLRAKGWTLRPAAQVLGVHWTHLHKVISGHRHSESLLRRIAALPTIPTRTTDH